MPYASQTDLMLGDILVAPSINLDAVITDASHEIDARVGEVYVVPLTGLSTHHQALIKLICARLATGRLILAVAAGGEDRALQAYGKSLVDMAYADIERIVCRHIVLSGVAESGPAMSSNLPGIINADAASAVTGFENFVMRGDATAWWEPGAAR